MWPVYFTDHVGFFFIPINQIWGKQKNLFAVLKYCGRPVCKIKEHLQSLPRRLHEAVPDEQTTSQSLCSCLILK